MTSFLPQTQRNKNKITRKQKDEPKLCQKRIRKDAVDKQNLRGGRVVLFGIFFCHHFNYFVPIPRFFNFPTEKKNMHNKKKLPLPLVLCKINIAF